MSWRAAGAEARSSGTDGRPERDPEIRPEARAGAGVEAPGSGAVAGIRREAELAERDGQAGVIRARAAEAARDEIRAGRPEAAGPSEGVEAPEPRFAMLRQLAMLFRGMLQRERWPVLRLAGGLVLVVVANMLGQVRLNDWNGAFFDAVEKKDVDAFLWQLVVFLMIVAVLLCIVVAQTWLQEMLKIRIRERLTHLLFDGWLQPNRAYQLGFAGEGGAAPDQRMQEDCRLFSEFTAELGVGMLNAMLLLVSFIGVLWTLSSQVTLTLDGRELAIPGYMVWVAVGYAGLGSGLTWLVGRPLIRLNTARYAREADLRFALVRVSESAESIALYGGEADERRHLEGALGGVLRATRLLSGALSRLTWITSGYGWVAIVVPILAAAPGYFNGSLSFGGLMMVVGAFTQVQQALRYYVDNFPRLADWRSAVQRVSIFYEAVDSVGRPDAETPHITIAPHPENKLAFDHLSIGLADGSMVIEEASAEISPGERVLIMGESGAGKSTLFRAIAGLWPWGSGTIRVPSFEQQMFLPQRPYLPLGTLRGAVCYPAPPDHFDDAAVRGALARCGLAEFADRLDADERWDRSLSLGQQQRVAFARLLLHRPRWVFMDEATSALDEESQASVLALFDRELKDATVLSIGHRPGLEEFHTRTLHLRKTAQGVVLFGRPRRGAQPPPTWRERVQRWVAGRRA